MGDSRRNGTIRSFARRAKTQLFRERESPNETALKLPASIAAPCCLSPLTPLHVRPSHMRRETKPLRGMGTTTAPQARGRARCCSACSHRGASAAAPALRGRCAASVRGRPRGRLFSLRPIGSLSSTRRHPSPVRPARARRRWFPVGLWPLSMDGGPTSRAIACLWRASLDAASFSWLDVDTHRCRGECLASRPAECGRVQAAVVGAQPTWTRRAHWVEPAQTRGAPVLEARDTLRGKAGADIPRAVVN